MQIFCFSAFGYAGSLVSVEVDLRRGIPAVDIVGLADGAVKESRERMKSAILNSGLQFPPERVLINLSPADLKKEGAGFDLAIALAVLSAKEKLERDATTFDPADLEHSTIPTDEDDSFLIMGELELNGRIRPVRAIHAAVGTAYEGGIRKCIVPAANAEEAREIDGMKVFGAEDITEAISALYNPAAFTGKSEEEKVGEVPEGAVSIDGIYFPPVEEDMDFKFVTAQELLVRGLQIAAAGGHNIIAFGPPGCGKTLSMMRFSSILPLLTREESQSITRIWSIAGLLCPGKNSILRVPVRMPHQTATIEGICGGGPHCMPGEISLAHNGVLFLDEAAEFRSSVLQMLRVPLESGSITLSRAGRSTIFPARFQLLLSTNPCPCGNYGSKDKICLCSARSVEQYWRKFSGPLLDRIDIRVQVESKAAKEGEVGISSAELRKKIAGAIRIQRKRQGKKNVFLTPSEIADFCKLTEEARKLLDKATDRYEFSPRAVSGCLKLARTIADMEGKADIDGKSMEEAIVYRKPQGAMDVMK
ncbi:YifB family Mg chelatase-like AAA ATPase [Treponema sp.]|uniref:YifB family Mg chelatase-like AAA ATPase n=1 Tax=Treponema sp. TaxID=166 RepID=UPI00298DFA33|nr:YifB family Mg chelatase-like AAA ATPase [Treponema sp.]MCQ2240350.1 YifB family Mg chelatase-like AAA ATPase [Treponema sp.]